MSPSTQRIFFFDIDGTLLDHSVEDVPRSTWQALHMLKANGHLLYINTSRSPNEMNNIRQFLAPHLFDGYILTGGALTVAGDQAVAVSYADLEDTAAALCTLENEGVSVRWQTRDALYFHTPPPPDVCAILMELFGETPPVRRWDGQPVTRLVFYGDQARIDRIQAIAPHSLALSQGFQVVNFTAAGVDKSTAMLAEAARLGLSQEQTVAFGDGYNDREMLSCAGCGIAMGNGEDAAKQAADYITTPIGEDGIYQACRHFGWI